MATTRLTDGACTADSDSEQGWQKKWVMQHARWSPCGHVADLVVTSSVRPASAVGRHALPPQDDDSYEASPDEGEGYPEGAGPSFGLCYASNPVNGAI